MMVPGKLCSHITRYGACEVMCCCTLLNVIGDSGDSVRWDRDRALVFNCARRFRFRGVTVHAVIGHHRP